MLEEGVGFIVYVWGCRGRWVRQPGLASTNATAAMLCRIERMGLIRSWCLVAVGDGKVEQSGDL